MLLNLYGDEGLVFQTLATGFKEAHLQDKIKFDVVEAEKVGQKFKEAVKKAYNAKFLDDADMVIRFAIPSQEPVEDTEKIELSDLEGYLEGYDVSFIKVSLKSKESPQEQ